MSASFKTFTLAIRPLAGLLFTDPVALAHDPWEHSQVHEELGEEDQEGHEDLTAAHEAFHSQPHSRRAHRRFHRMLNREHQALHEDLNAQHQDYHGQTWNPGW